MTSCFRRDRLSIIDRTGTGHGSLSSNIPGECVEIKYSSPQYSIELKPIMKLYQKNENIIIFPPLSLHVVFLKHCNGTKHEMKICRTWHWWLLTRLSTLNLF